MQSSFQSAESLENRVDQADVDRSLKVIICDYRRLQWLVNVDRCAPFSEITDNLNEIRMLQFLRRPNVD